MSEVGYFVENGIVCDCNFDIYGETVEFSFGSGCRNIHFKGETKRCTYNMRMPHAILQEGLWNGRPAPQNIVFENYDFTGGNDLIQGGSALECLRLHQLHVQRQGPMKKLWREILIGSASALIATWVWNKWLKDRVT